MSTLYCPDLSVHLYGRREISARMAPMIMIVIKVAPLVANWINAVDMRITERVGTWEKIATTIVIGIVH